MSEEKNDGMPEEEFSALLQSVSTMAPLLRGLLSPVGGGSEEKSDPCRRREALLLALKPYLSPARCDAVDYLIRLSRVGDAIKALR